MNIKRIIKKCFWSMPLPTSFKLKLLRKNEKPKDDTASELHDYSESINDEYALDYTRQILSLQSTISDDYVEYTDHEKFEKRATLIAYYLTQYHPTKENNLWWGKGTTEWTNVTKSVPQFIGHYQPRMAGELGYYDLRIKENISEQANIARNYGIDAFAFYYYWFNGRRVLEKPLNLFLDNKDINIHFCLCWANENWTKRFTSDNNEVTLYLDDKPETYKQFITDIIAELSDERYLRIHKKLVLIVYRPSLIPDTKEVLSYWREYVKGAIGEELYLIASQEKGVDFDWTKMGFDAMSQFQPASLNDKAVQINDEKRIIDKNFAGRIFSYKSIIEKKLMLPSNKKTFPAVMPMWDNTPRRKNTAVIYDGSTPDLYKEWLDEAIGFVEDVRDREERLVFLNAWNEWGEGAYLEPDRIYGYAYLEKTHEANKAM